MLYLKNNSVQSSVPGKALATAFEQSTCFAASAGIYVSIVFGLAKTRISSPMGNLVCALVGIQFWSMKSQHINDFIENKAEQIYINYPLVNIQKTMERSTIFNGKIHYFYHHFKWENPLFLSPFLMGKSTISITIFNGKIHYFYHNF